MAVGACCVHVVRVCHTSHLRDASVAGVIAVVTNDLGWEIPGSVLHSARGVPNKAAPPPDIAWRLAQMADAAAASQRAPGDIEAAFANARTRLLHVEPLVYFYCKKARVHERAHSAAAQRSMADRAVNEILAKRDAQGKKTGEKYRAAVLGSNFTG